MRLLGSVQYQFPLGTTTDGKSAGSLWIHEDTPAADLATPATLHYDFYDEEGQEAVLDGVVMYPGQDDEYQIETPLIRADVSVIDDYSYAISLFTLDELPSVCSGDYCDLSSITPFKKWIVENPDGALDYNSLHLTYMVDDETGSLVTHAAYEYEYEEINSNSSKWTLTIKDSQGNTEQIQEKTTAFVYNTELQKDQKTEETLIKASNGTVILEHYSVYEEFFYLSHSWGWRPVYIRNGDSSTGEVTERTYEADEYGVRLASEKRPNGTWTWYDYSDLKDGSGAFIDLEITKYSGWLDTPYPSTCPTETSSSVRAVRLTYDSDQKYRLINVVEWIGGESNIVRQADYDYTVQNGVVVASTFEQHEAANSTTPLITEITYTDYADDRVDTIVYPDGRQVDYGYDDDITLTIGTTSTPHTYSLADSGTGYRYREIVNGYDDNGTLAYVSGKSTKATTVIDPSGHTLLTETWVWTGSAWDRTDWVSYVYDTRGRLTDTLYSTGIATSASYASCCETTTIDELGVSTTTSRDVLGRTDTVVQSEITGGASYVTQPAVTTSYNYETPRQTTITTSAGAGDDALLESAIRYYDTAGRILSEETDNGICDLKTIYTYDDASASEGQKVTVYSDYPTSATEGTSGTRDRITTYYMDGRIKSVTGSSMIPQYYSYSRNNGQITTTVTQGSANGDRWSKSTTDMLGRIISEERPAWVATGDDTLTTTYHYDGPQDARPGVLRRIERSDGADTYYEYDNLGNLTYTILDVDEDGTIDYSGPDRINRSESFYANDTGIDSNWWHVSRTWILPNDNSSAEVLMSQAYSRVSGFSSGVVSESRIIDIHGNTTIATTAIDSSAHTRTQTTDSTESGTDSVRVMHGGQMVSSISATGVTQTYAYDALGRRTETTDSLGNMAHTYYYPGGKILASADEENYWTYYVYYADTSAHPGRLYTIMSPSADGASEMYTYYAYNDLGQTTHVWGDVPYPVEMGYNAYGEKTTLRTFRGGSHWASLDKATAFGGVTGDTTTWNYDPATGLLESKVYDDGSSVSYAYTPNGQLHVRTWDREVGGSPLTTTYSYNDGTDSTLNTGELREVNYSDSTPDVTYSYDRIGRLDQVTDAAGTRALGYDPNHQSRTTESFGTGSLFGDLVLTQSYETGSPGVDGRYNGVLIGTSSDDDAYYAVTYGYDSVGRIETVFGPGLPAGTGGGATYAYETDTDRVETLSVRDSGTERFRSTWTYGDDRGYTTSLSNTWYDSSGANPQTVSQYDYGYDARGQRTYHQRIGEAFSAAHYDGYTYNERGELTGAQRHTATYPTENPESSGAYAYDYDSIGNRRSADGGDESAIYSSNGLNQYWMLNRQEQTAGGSETYVRELEYDSDGNLTAYSRFTVTEAMLEELVDDLTGPSVPTTLQSQSVPEQTSEGLRSMTDLANQMRDSRRVGMVQQMSIQNGGLAEPVKRLAVMQTDSPAEEDPWTYTEGTLSIEITPAAGGSASKTLKANTEYIIHYRAEYPGTSLVMVAYAPTADQGLSAASAASDGDWALMDAFEVLDLESEFETLDPVDETGLRRTDVISNDVVLPCGISGELLRFTTGQAGPLRLMIELATLDEESLHGDYMILTMDLTVVDSTVQGDSRGAVLASALNSWSVEGDAAPELWAWYCGANREESLAAPLAGSSLARAFLAAMVNQTAASEYDFDQDGDVDLEDYSLLMQMSNQADELLTLEWDAENRLSAVYPSEPSSSDDKKVTFTYDYRHRRIRKVVTAWDDQADDWSTTNESDIRYVWDDWVLLMEVDATSGGGTTGGVGDVVRKYTWGLDLSGQRSGTSLTGAGCIGGLLAVEDSTIGTFGAEYLYTYDANGNVGQVVSIEPTSWNEASVIVAAYEYDPYGNVIEQSGTYAETNRWRFSTKQFDAETGFGYWGYRYYLPELGRWGNRDPIEEKGGWNVYSYASSNPMNMFDILGMISPQYLPVPWPYEGRDYDPTLPDDGFRQQRCPLSPNTDDDCQKTCDQMQGEFPAGSLAKWICRSDGSRCPCVNKKKVKEDYPNEKAQGIITHCLNVHEQTHAEDAGGDCSCEPKPCWGEGKNPEITRGRECNAHFAEWKCLQSSIAKCGSDESCIQKCGDDIMCYRACGGDSGCVDVVIKRMCYAIWNAIGKHQCMNFGYEERKVKCQLFFNERPDLKP